MKHNRLMAMLLSLAIALSFMPAMAFAEEGDAADAAAAPMSIEEAVSDANSADTSEDEASAADAQSGPDAELGAQGELAAGDIVQYEAEYNLWVGGTRVTESNRTNVLGDGKVSFDASSNTLTLNGATINRATSVSDDLYCIYSNDIDLTIVLNGSNTIGADGGSDADTDSIFGIFTESGSLKISGGGSLTVETYGEAIHVDEDMIVDGTTINASAAGENQSNAIAVYGSSFKVIGSSVTANGKGLGIYSPEADVTIRDSAVTAKGGYYVGMFAGKLMVDGSSVNASGGMAGIASGSNIEISNSKGGRYSTRVEASASGEMGDYFAENPFAIISFYEGTVKINDDLLIVEPKGAEVKKYAQRSAIGEEYVTTIVLGDTPAKHVVIEAESSGNFVAKMTAKGKKSLNISWTEVGNADGYDIFFSRCNAGGKKYKCKLAASVKRGEALSYTKKGLKARRAYKAYVKAYTMRNGVKTYIKKSPTVHAYASGSSGRFTNPKSVKVKKAKLTVSAGKTVKIKASVKRLKKGKKIMTHRKKLRYMSSDTAVATVTKSGKIKGVSAGSCTVTVYSVNGVSKDVEVTVN